MIRKTAIVTGGTRGIGLEITNAFALANYNVYVGARSIIPKDKLPQFTTIVESDVRKEIDVRRLVATAKEETGRVDVIVNNAGYSEWRPLEKIDESFLQNILATNLMGVFWGCKAAAEVMESGGSIINISSMAGKRGSTNNSAYVATKFAMNGITQSLCKELGPRGIRVNGLCPVLIPTPGLIEALRNEDSPSLGDDPIKFIAKFAESNAALKRMPTGAEVAAACIFLASDEASAITGQNINIDCGVFPQ